LVRVSQILHVAVTEFDVLEFPGRRLAPSDCEQPVGEIYRDHLARWPDLLGGGDGRGARPAADIEDGRTGLEREPLEGAAAIFRPQPERFVVEVIRGGIIGRRRFHLDRIRDRQHRTLDINGRARRLPCASHYRCC
jgi:hypothetical protein